ncbi:MAG: 2-phospho-L-lactate transferase [Actinomycetia bacterium]|nr:2-phospho-L-lactate transferase [Actinomycetes bacterium]
MSASVRPNGPSIACIAGGVGAARMLRGLVRISDQVTAVANVGDDVELHGLHISPDLDTITYTVAEAIDQERGWGLADETWHAMEALARYGGLTWFNLGDKDLATHLFRTQQLHQGATLSTVTNQIARAWDLPMILLPVTDDPLRTHVVIDDPDLDHPVEIEFQEYFVKHQHSVPVRSIRFAGAGQARPAPGVVSTIEQADVVVIAPSNPLVSIDPVLAVPGVREAVTARREAVVGVSPIIAGAALKGPADRLLRELGHEASVVGVARLYAPLAATLVIDEADHDRVAEVEAEGIRCVVAPTIMKSAHDAATLAQVVVDCVT